MNILHVIPRFPYYGEDVVIGGAASALYNLIKIQSETCNVSIIGESPNSDPKPIIDCGATFIPLTVRSPVSSFLFGMEYSLKQAYLVSKLEYEIDVIHGHSGFFDYVFSTMLAGRVRRIPTVHTIYCPLLLDNIWKAYIYKFISRFVDQYISISQNVTSSLLELGISREKINEIPPAVNIQRFSESNSEKAKVRKKIGLPDNSPTLLFVGNSKKQKNLEAVLEALAIVRKAYPDCNLIITTELESEKNHERVIYLKDKIRSLSLEENIQWRGLVTNMDELMKAADLLIAPFLNTFGPSDYFIAALEAMASGIPVVVSDVGGMPEVVDNEVGYLISPEDKYDIADKVLKILNNPNRKKIMGENAQKRVRTIFDPHQIHHHVLEIYRKIEL